MTESKGEYIDTEKKGLGSELLVPEHFALAQTDEGVPEQVRVLSVVEPQGELVHVRGRSHM